MEYTLLLVAVGGAGLVFGALLNSRLGALPPATSADVPEVQAQDGLPRRRCDHCGEELTVSPIHPELN